MAVDWRTYGDVPLDTFRAELARVNSPMLPDAEAIWNAARPHSALALAMMWVEQKYATYGASPIPSDFYNPLSLANPNGSALDGINRWERYWSYAEGVQAWKDRITSPTYKDGIYAGTVTLADLVRIYAPPHDANDTNLYVDTVQGLLNKWPRFVAAEVPVSTLNMSKGLIPLPPIEARFITNKPEGIGWNDLGPRTVKGVTLHRMQGTLAGTDQFFRNPSVGALTDFGVDHESGLIYQWVDPKGRISGWASGPYSGAFGDGLAFGQKYGVNAVNQHRASMEFSGYFDQPIGSGAGDDPVSDVAWQRVAQWVAHYAHDYGITWEQFPISAVDGFSFVCWHTEFTAGTGKQCPGKTIMDGTARLIEATRAIMKSYQTGGVVKPPSEIPTYAAPAPLDLGVWDGLDRTLSDGTVLYALRRRVTTRTATKRYRVADRNGGVIGPDLKRGDVADIEYVFQAGNTGPRWYYTPWGTRLVASHFTPYTTVRTTG
jgi:hypothetical protein